MQYKVTNISRTSASPAGIRLQFAGKDGQPGKVIEPGKFVIAEKIDETLLGWQEKGWAKIDPMKDPLVMLRDDIATQPLPATVQEVKLNEDEGDDLLGEPEIDLAAAVEAEMPSGGLIKQASTPENTKPINQSTAQDQKQEGSKPRARVNQKEYRTETKNTARASMMGAEPTRQVDKNEEIDAMNPLLDEKAKSVDNSDDSHTVQAPARTSYERGSTIKQ